ncbi:hypothetical protein UA08_04853 [Talaromyces atroroseus]|uniref:Mannosyltransferase n=1 Tax=Talaromyces atroroseus TaxID=1441469 RepID=A0A225AX81_TALAT|nr:hypothetical protein UA08_04853 [Talaromyces atroroseus]OKL60229.1 hypothetical protein UA08_04853 [Talaromyces atroroseus]
MARLTDVVFYSLLPAVILIHLLAAPYTKVEESFHIQATHDILTYGIPSPLRLDSAAVASQFRSNYDHFSFPGAVPRTFIGALGLASASWPIVWLHEHVDRQFLARAILGLFNALSLNSYARGLQKAFGSATAYWYLIFQASQFHVAYYASRTLSNMFAFGLTTIALRLLLPCPNASNKSSTSSGNCRYRLSLILFTVTGIIFRSELALLLATNTAYFLLSRRIRIQQDILPAGIIGLLVGLTATVVIDSYFWQEFPLWPEFNAFKFNVVSGQASAWGVDPWYFYFVNALPRLLLNPLSWLVGIPVSLLADATRPTSLSLLVPSLVFVAIYSIQPHKEWRFIIYIIPALTAAAAQGAAYIWIRRRKSTLYRILSLSLVLSTLGSLVVSNLVLLPISSANYPGAQAIQRVHFHGQGTPSHVVLYMGNLACQTGVTRFLQQPQEDTDAATTKWTYDKTENSTLKSTPTFWSNIDYALVEDNELAELRSHSADPESWQVIDTITGFAGFKLIKPSDSEQPQLRTGDHFHSSSIEIDAIKWLAGDKGVECYEKIRDGFARRYLTGGYWVEMSLEPKIRVVKHLASNQS